MSALENPITIEPSLTYTDFFWNLVYGWRRVWLKRIVFLLGFIFFMFLTLKDNNLSSFQLGLHSVLAGIGLLLLTFFIDAAYFYLPILFNKKQRALALLPVKITFYNDGFERSSKVGDSKNKYEVFQKIYIYKKLIIFKFAIGSIIIPCRDIPKELRDEFFIFLKDLNNNLKKPI